MAVRENDGVAAVEPDRLSPIVELQPAATPLDDVKVPVSFWQVQAPTPLRLGEQADMAANP